jgi:hypothetical protein
MPENHAGSLLLLVKEIKAVGQTSVIECVHDGLPVRTVAVKPAGGRTSAKSKGPVRCRRGLAGSAMRLRQRMRPYGNPPLGVVVVCMVVEEERILYMARLSPYSHHESNRIQRRHGRYLSLAKTAGLLLRYFYGTDSPIKRRARFSILVPLVQPGGLGSCLFDTNQSRPVQAAFVFLTPSHANSTCHRAAPSTRRPMMKRPSMKPAQSNDFDVISGPSMASACPIVEDAPIDQQGLDPELAPQDSKADAA